MKAKNMALLAAVIVALAAITATADTDADAGIEEGRKLIESNASCSSLADSQLEAIGDYYMEQMHPGESHELMDRMMGGEGSAQLRQVHISMARKLYCNEYAYGKNATGMMGGGMMGSGGMMSMMMGNSGMTNYGGFGSGYGMMGSWGGSLGWGLQSILWLAILTGLAVVVWLWAIKLGMEVFGRRRR